MSGIGEASHGGKNGDSGESRPGGEVDEDPPDDDYDGAEDAPDAGQEDPPEDQYAEQDWYAEDDDSSETDDEYVAGAAYAEDGAYAGGIGASPLLVGLIGAAIGMLVMGVIWAGFALADKDDGSTAAEPAAPVSEAAEGATVLGTEEPSPQAPDRLAGCRAVVAAQAAPLAAAPRALDQWEVHVGAMNKLVVGAISLDQATAFWDQTRVGAARNVHAFLVAANRYHDTSARCLTRGSGADQVDRVRSCHRAVAARDKVISAAGRAARTWNKHVFDMEMLRMGHLTPARATQMWLASWHTGVRQLDAYHAAVRTMKGHPC